MRDLIKAEVSSILPADDREKHTQQEVLSWIESGVELCRVEKPATPPIHLVSYFVVADFPYLLLVDHINAQLWLPTGGHVDVFEHPRDTVVREAKEELGIDSDFLFEKPVFLTSSVTVGFTAGHTDVSLWYVLRGNRNARYDYDVSEFAGIRWFHTDEIPYAKSDPEMRRFVDKLSAMYGG